MESEENMNSGEGLGHFMPTEELIVVGRLPLSIPLYGSDADDIVYRNTTRFCSRGTFEELVVFCRTKFCDSRSVESANGQTLEDVILRNANTIPITR